MAGNDDIDYLLENRQLLLVHVEPFPAMDSALKEKMVMKTVLVTVKDAIEIVRDHYMLYGIPLKSERDLLVEYMSQNCACVFHVNGIALTESDLVKKRDKTTMKSRILLGIYFVILFILVTFTVKHLLDFAEALNRQ